MAEHANELCSKVELIFSARNLLDKDLFSKSDPLCVVFGLLPKSFQKNFQQNIDNLEEIGRTETIQNCLNPQWNKKIRLNYYFEAKQPLRFEIYDVDSASAILSKHDFLGRCECHLADIVAAPNATLTLPLTGVAKGHLTIRADELDDGQKESLYMVCHGRSLDRKDFFGKSDPFLEFYRFVPQGDIGNNFGTRQMVHRTEFIKKTLNPEWKPFEITVRHLCEGDKDREFIIECYDYNKNGSLQLEFAVAIDLTASNGNPHSINSLHYIDFYKPNQYQSAIRAVLDICQHYNQSKKFDALGFGAKIPPNGAVSHLFPLDLITFIRTVNGVEGVLEVYKQAISKVTLYGPTNFSPIISDFAHKAKMFPKDASRYQILLIITDGIITDMEKTKAALIGASDLPLSVIIVGVGNENFEKMDELDSDDQLLTYNGRTAVRDIVQFVPFRNFLGAVANNYSPADQSFIQSQLAKEVLAEVPDQITGYMKTHGISPLPIQLNSQLEAYNSQPQAYPSLNSSQNLEYVQNSIINDTFIHSSAPPYQY